jgi:hypothetical protein
MKRQREPEAGQECQCDPYTGKAFNISKSSLGKSFALIFALKTLMA